VGRRSGALVASEIASNPNLIRIATSSFQTTDQPDSGT
jgi:hypothetical protein